MDILTLIGLFFVGLFLGLLGGGGAVILVPLLTQVTNFPFLIATSYSLIIIGITAFLGSIPNILNNKIKYFQAITILIPAILSTILTRKYLIEILPQTIFNLNKENYLFLLFILIMFVSAIIMLKPYENRNYKPKPCNFLLLLFISIFLGILTGLTGLGGGFLIIPTLIILCKLDVKLAISTSLFIIALNTLIAGLSEIHLLFENNFLIYSIILTLVGFAFGKYLQKFISNTYLRKFFGIFLICLSIILLFLQFI